MQRFIEGRNRIITYLHNPLTWRPPNYLSLRIISSSYIYQKIKINLFLSQNSTSNQSDVSTLILFLSKGREGKAWEPNKMLFLPPEIVSLTSPH
jgi:hypothetical protein